jgi:hypothetical protein
VTDLEAVRRAHLPPDGIRLLLLGESPPPGKGFFYTGDSTLFRATVPVFVEECGFPSGATEFLSAFAGGGFFLEDFSSIRGAKPHLTPQHHEVAGTVRRLAKLVTEYAPVAVVGVLREIEGLVQRVVAESDRPDTPVSSLRFPYYRSPSAQRAYQHGLRRVIAEYGCK